ncbi:MAG: hypothetical protein JWO82_1659 [Akkermansiaceae bacterium]|nr:hypothetical protein [Akkermansiaceae bacterium]
MDLIREILQRTEDGSLGKARGTQESEQLMYHIELAEEAGLLRARLTRRSTGSVVLATVERLTWAGHEFLDAARSETLWQQAKTKVLQTGGAWTMEALKLMLFEMVRKNLTGH